MNKYETWYAAITNSGQYRHIDSYTESHHIIPRSLGGNDDPTNITKLTAREHFICHWLLTKIHREGEAHWKMLNAIRIMRAENAKQTRYSNKITARVYNNLKEEYSKLQSEKMMGENNPMYGRPVSEEVRKGRSERATGNNNPAKRPGIGAKISAKAGENNHRYGVEVTDETRKKIGDKIRGRKQTEEEKLARGIANLGKKREKKLCPHCSKEVAVNGYARWHGDNCKSKRS